MGKVTDKIRDQVGEGELTDAIDELVGFLKTVGGDLYNQSIHLKGKFKEYQRDRLLGVGDRQEVKSQISLAVLDLTTEIDKRNLENPPTKVDFEKLRPDPAEALRQQQQDRNLEQQNFQQPVTNHLAQCFFTGDLMQYYITQQDQILAVNPMTNQSLIVGSKMPSQDFRFAWTFFVQTTGIYYLVDHSGLIWGQNYGMPVQVGYVKYF